MMSNQHRPLLLVVSAPSGAGKTTLCQKLRDEDPRIRYSISCTTRPPRPGEVDGENYHFLDEELFNNRKLNGDFLEHAMVHDFQYGTLKRDVLSLMEQGFDVLMDIDVQGAEQLRNYAEIAKGKDLMAQGFVDIFIEPPSVQVLRERIEGRATDTPEVIERRMKNALVELEHRNAYKYVVENNLLENSMARLREIIHLERTR